MSLPSQSSYLPPYPANGSPFPVATKTPDKVPVPIIHYLLFLVTLGTTTIAGAFAQGANPFADPFSVVSGLPFSLTLLSILLAHEMGHYLVAGFHGVRATFPYFIPGPFFFPGPPFFVGTFGAFIRIKSMPANRRALFDVGAAGPWAGVLVAIPAVMIGLALSEVQPLNRFESGTILGDSFLFSALAYLVLGVSPNEVSVILHPIALAGWFGLFITFLNLLPVGQLDGGHVTYSLFGRGHRWIARAFLLTILFLGLNGWPGWFVWVVLVAILGIDHPPTFDRFSPLDPRRKFYAWSTVALFALTFIPVPVSLTEGPEFPAGKTTPIAYHPDAPAPSRLFVYQP